MLPKLFDIWERHKLGSSWPSTTNLLGSLTKNTSILAGAEVFKVVEFDYISANMECIKSRSGQFLCGTVLLVQYRNLTMPPEWRILYTEVKKKQPDILVASGASCAICKGYNEYAIANQADGRFKCWSCRSM